MATAAITIGTLIAPARRQLAGPLGGPDRQRPDRVLAAQAAAILIAQLAAWVIRFCLGAEVASLLAS